MTAGPIRRILFLIEPNGMIAKKYSQVEFCIDIVIIRRFFRRGKSRERDENGQP